MKKCLIVSFIIGLSIFFLPPKLLAGDKEHFVLGAHIGPSFGLFGKREGVIHLGYDFQVYFSKSIGIQLEYFSEQDRSDKWFFVNLMYKFRETKNKKFQPYLSIGYGTNISVFGETVECAAKMGGGVKYRLTEHSSPLIINLNSALFFFFPHEDNSFFGNQYKRHFSIYVGLEIGS